MARRKPIEINCPLCGTELNSTFSTRANTKYGGFRWNCIECKLYIHRNVTKLELNKRRSNISDQELFKPKSNNSYGRWY
jgi:hypothetical protein